MTPDSRQRAMRAQGICEQAILTGPRKGESCRNRATWKRREARDWIDSGLRVCGNHARSYQRWSLVQIGSNGWQTA